MQADRLQFEPDAVLADMLRRMHLVVTEESSSFEPEGGAYGGHGATQGHDHDQGHDHGDHVHGPGCDHAH